MHVSRDFYGCPISNIAPPDPARHRANVATAFSILKPSRPPRALVRIGGTEDGAYLLPADLDGIGACYSPGVNNRKTFEDELCQKFGIPCHMCDFSSDLSKLSTPLIPTMQTFEKLWLGVTDGPESISLNSWIKRYRSDGKDLILQIDIEGAEYRNILGATDETLARFRVIVMEVHGLLTAFYDETILEQVLLPFLRKLDKSFVCIHAHPNNYGSEFMIPEVGANMSDVMELTFVRRDWHSRNNSSSLAEVALPHLLDIKPNARHRKPITLNEKWMDHGRPAAAKIRALEDELDYLYYLQESHANQYEDINEMVASTVDLGLRAVHDRIGSGKSAIDAMEEVAVGKSYALSTYSGGVEYGHVPKERVPYFFHTGFGANQSITVDLGRVKTVRRVNIANRRDACFARARLLFLVLHTEKDPRTGQVAAIDPPRGFLRDGSADAVVDTPPTKARYVTIVSPLRNYLHLSNINVFAEPELN